MYPGAPRQPTRCPEPKWAALAVAEHAEIVDFGRPPRSPAALLVAKAHSLGILREPAFRRATPWQREMQPACARVVQREAFLLWTSRRSYRAESRAQILFSWS
jgi:hypothetical protein